VSLGVTFGGCGCQRGGFDPLPGGGVGFGRRWDGARWTYYNLKRVETPGYIVFTVPRAGIYQHALNRSGRTQIQFFSADGTEVHQSYAAFNNTLPLPFRGEVGMTLGGTWPAYDEPGPAGLVFVQWFGLVG
jgi:hypothetical protein